MPVLAEEPRRERGGRVMERVIIGIDPHKLPVTIEARDNRETCGPRAGSALTPAAITSC